MRTKMYVIGLEKHPSNEENGGAAIVVAHNVEEALELLHWQDATVNTLLDYQGSRSLPWIVAQYNAQGELLVHPGVVNG